MSIKTFTLIFICLVAIWLGEQVEAQYWDDYYSQFEPVVDQDDLAYQRYYQVSS